MSDKSKIEWTEATWNPIRGCSRISEGCRNCYAEVTANRFKSEGQPYEGLIARSGQWNGTIKFIDAGLHQPLRWRRPRMIFVNSMSDLFHENLHIEQIAKIFAVMCLAHWHTFQVLTKRAERMHEVLTNPEFYGKVLKAADEIRTAFPKINIGISDPIINPPKNVWLGVSVEDQPTARSRIISLIRTPAALRWISAEPLIGPVDIEDLIKASNHLARGIDWVVVGGESVPGKSGHNSLARPMHPDWARALRDQCLKAGIPFFFKQWGSYSYDYDRERDDPDWRDCSNVQRKPGRWVNISGHHGFHGERVHYAQYVGKKKSGRILDGRTWDEYPSNTA